MAALTRFKPLMPVEDSIEFPPIRFPSNARADAFALTVHVEPETLAAHQGLAASLWLAIEKGLEVMGYDGIQVDVLVTSGAPEDEPLPPGRARLPECFVIAETNENPYGVTVSPPYVPDAFRAGRMEAICRAIETLAVEALEDVLADGGGA